MNTNTKIIGGALVLALIFFYGGVTYGKAHASTVTGAVSRSGNFAGALQGGMSRRGMGGAGGGFVMGTVLSKDATTLTVSLQGGGSKIVFVGSSTPVTKTVSGTLDDISVGTSVLITGSAGSDGSVTARTIEIRPDMPQNMNTNR